MKADRQQAADLLTRAHDLGHNPGGAQSDPAARDRDPLVIHHDIHRIAHVFKVVKRLAHAHQHHIGNAPAPLVRGAILGPFLKIIARHHHLRHDLASTQVAHQFLGAGMAKTAIQRAAHLRGNTQGAPVLIRDIDHLDLMAAGNAQQVFAGAVG